MVPALALSLLFIPAIRSPAADDGGARQVSVEFVEDSNVRGRITGDTTPSRRTLELDGKPHPLRDVLRIHFSRRTSKTPDPVSSMTVELADGSVIHGSLGEFPEASDGSTDRILLTGPMWPQGLVIALDWVRRIDHRQAGAARKPPSPRAAGRGRPGEMANGGDRILTTKGAHLNGILEGVHRAGVNFEDSSLGRLTLPWEQIEIVFVAALEAPPTLAEDAIACTVEGREGSHIRGALKALSNNQVRVESPLVGEITLPTADLRELELHLGRVVYLTEREPLRVTEGTPYSEYFPWTWRKNRNVEGGPLRIGPRTYRRGLGVHSESRLVFPIESGDLVFQSEIGIDAIGRLADDNPEIGSALFRVLVDGKERYSGEMSWSMLPRHIEVEIATGRELELVVEMGKGHHILDRADWADARIIRE